MDFRVRESEPVVEQRQSLDVTQIQHASWWLPTDESTHCELKNTQKSDCWQTAAVVTARNTDAERPVKLITELISVAKASGEATQCAACRVE